jgi:type IV secretory pathway TrbL component
VPLLSSRLTARCNITSEMDAETEKIIMSPLQLNNNAGAARSSAVGGARPSNTAGTSRPSANVNSSNANSKTHRSSSHVGNLAGSPTAGSGTGSLPTSMASSPATQRAIAPARADSGSKPDSVSFLWPRGASVSLYLHGSY